MSALHGWKMSKGGGKEKQPTQRNELEELMKQFPD
jgi:hypothetical protein|tara:strand:- start:485 stop:589 length:105 start_codon:yes stop_codon:yes gene_type:complete